MKKYFLYQKNIVETNMLKIVRNSTFISPYNSAKTERKTIFCAFHLPIKKAKFSISRTKYTHIKPYKQA